MGLLYKTRVKLASFNVSIQVLSIFTVFNSSSVVAAPSILLDRLEASVNASLILTSDIRKYREIVKLRTQLDPLFAGTPLAAKGANATDSEIIEFLINERLVSQEYPKSSAEIAQEIASIESSNHLSHAGLKEALSREGYKYTDYEDLIGTSSSKREALDREIRPKVQASISDDDIKNYFYNKMPRNNAAHRAYHIQIISISLADYKSPAAANSVMLDALKSIQAGESFDEAASRMNPDSGTPNGDLGVLTEDKMSPMFLEQVKKLQIGKVSGVFGGKTGNLYLLKLLDIKSSESEHFDKVKEEIRGQLMAAEFQHQMNLWLERKKQKAFIHRAGVSYAKEVPLVP